MPAKKAVKGKAKGKKAVVEEPVDPYLKGLQEKSLDELKEEEKKWKDLCAKEKRNRTLAMYDRV